VDDLGALPRYLAPSGAQVDSEGRLAIQGVSVADLAAKYGTPLFVYDLDHVTAQMRQARSAFPGSVVYASKAFSSLCIAELAAREGLWWDAASEGEAVVAHRGKMPASRIVLHGNNKSDAELQMVKEQLVGRVAVDSFEEIERLADLSVDRRVKVWVRITPGIEAHTHEYVRTGQADSKFGFNLENGDAERALKLVRSKRNLELVGLHAHIGSQIFELSFFDEVVDLMVELARRESLGELSLGGGVGVAYVKGEDSPSISEWVERLSKRASGKSFDPAGLFVEPGRSIVATAAITVYRVGVVKKIPGIRTYVAVDGGMSDNPRPVLYDSGYEAYLPDRLFAAHDMEATVVGKHCESGDILVRKAHLPANVSAGELLITPVTGAYGYSMGSNYNRLPRPAVVGISGGQARLVIRRETVDDLLRLELEAAG
jgi:diaminopimelate decarboxylase